MKAGWRMFGDTIAHTHADTDVLTVGCAGCIQRADSQTSHEQPPAPLVNVSLFDPQDAT